MHAHTLFAQGMGVRACTCWLSRRGQLHVVRRPRVVRAVSGIRGVDMVQTEGHRCSPEFFLLHDRSIPGKAPNSILAL
eukprot:9546959-Alexandrium_andersonii.AAC.1